MRITRRTETVTLEGTVDEIRALFGRAQLALPADFDGERPNPQSLTAGDGRRYQDTGRVGNYGEREAVDRRTGRRGAFVLESMGGGFVPGARVRDDGRIEYEHPSDNPLQGCRW